jgi:hypothetical protein
MRANNHCLDCACVIHGDAYPWIYVENLYEMLLRNLDCDVRFHVFTEPDRVVPTGWHKHDLEIWPEIRPPLHAWWYKMQMFDPRHRFPGPLLYLDLDVVISGDLNWLRTLDHDAFWAIRDFRYLWRPTWQGINSSMMYWKPARYAKIWQDFCRRSVLERAKEFHGDQDFLTRYIPAERLRFFDADTIKSYRWQIKDGGMNPGSRKYLRPDAGAVIPPATRVIVFHGQPKPLDIADPVIQSLWSHK